MTDTPDPSRAIVENYFGTGNIDALLAVMEKTPVKGGQWLFRQGDPGDSLYFLIRGRLQVVIESGEDHGPEKVVAEVVPGDSVGEVGLLSGEVRSAGIRAIRDSLLLRLGRPEFEAMTQQHPALVMKLAANIAQLMQRNSAGKSTHSKRLSTVSILPLSESTAVMEFCHQLARAMQQFGSTLSLTADNLGSRGAPVPALSEDEAIPEALLHWLHDQENAFRHVVFSCDAAASSWTRMALRQSDIVLLIGDAGADPKPGDWERALTGNREHIARPALILLQKDSKHAITGTDRWLQDRDVDFHLHVRPDKPEDTARVARMVCGQATGLVLAGGAARGIAHLGIYKAMRELGVPVDWIGGVSIGSIMGAGMAMDLEVDEALDAARQALVHGKPFSDYTLPLISLVSGKRMDRILGEFFTQNIEDLPIPYFCISCKLDDGALNIHQRGPLATALRASASMPGIFPPAVVDGRLTVDGSVINNLPVDVMQQKPVGEVIAVDLASQKTYEVAYASVPSAWSVLMGQILPFKRRQRVPRLATTLLKSTELGTLGRIQELGQQADLLLRPPVRKFGMTEVRAFDQMVEVSYQYALEAISKWLETRGTQK